MKRSLSILTASAFLSGTAAFADTWMGRISDSMCGAKHKSSAEHGNAKMTDRECTAACVKSGGKYVFISNNKVYEIQNQDYAGLAEHAGHAVRLSGDMTGDSVNISKIEMPR